MGRVNHQISRKTTPQKYFTYAAANQIPSPSWFLLEHPGCPNTTPEVTNTYCFFPDKKVSALWKNLPWVSNTSSLLLHVSWYKIKKGNARSVHYSSDPEPAEVHGFQRAGIASRGNKLFSPQTLREEDTVTCPKRQKHYPLLQLINI